MKNLLMTVVLMTGLATFAQQKEPVQTTRPNTEKLSTEQRNELRLKEMTLELDLNATQQKEMAKIISEQSAKRQTAMAERKANKDQAASLTADQKFERKSKKIDEKIAMKKRIQGILTADQFAKWETIKASKHQNMRHGKKQGHRKEADQKQK